MRITILLAICLLMSAITPASSETAYTDPTAFTGATSALAVTHFQNFDSQADGSYATNYGKLSMWGNGLDSNGLTAISLPPVAVNAYPTTSAANAMGAQSGTRQLLSGNSDSVSFSFTGPVHSFGISLIGNPSPTGIPAIPFWKMTINTPSGFSAYSTTDPLATLSPGNDHYFLGVVSEVPFTQVTLYSDNDPNAVFSFNIDDIKYGTNAQIATITEAKSLPIDTVVKLSDVTITRVHPGFSGSRFYVESMDRLAGIAVIGSSGYLRGDSLDFTGQITMTSDDEVAITLDEVIDGESSAAPASFGMNTLSLGGTTSVGSQIGIPGSVGPNNIGLDVCISGTITEVHYDPFPYGPGSWIILDDGAVRACGDTINKGVKVTGAINAYSRTVGQFVTLRGSVSLWKAVDGVHYPLVRVADAGDITPP